MSVVEERDNKEPYELAVYPDGIEVLELIMKKLFLIMPHVWEESFWHTVNALSEGYSILKGKNWEKDFDSESDAAIKFEEDFYTIFYKFMLIPNDIGINLERHILDRIKELHTKNRDSKYTIDPMDLLMIALGFLSDISTIVFEYFETDEPAEVFVYRIHTSFGRALYWTGMFRGTVSERSLYGISVNASNAAKKSHEKHYKIRDELQLWWLESRDQFKTQEKAILKAMELFDVSYGTAGKHIRSAAKELRSKKKQK